MENIGILHLSDFHTSQESITKLSRLNKIFIDDAKTVSAEKKAKIEILCITGDMINDGSKGSVEYDLFFENILLPIIEELHIPEERVFIVPGNHEVDTKKINEFTESGMISTLIDKEKINGFMKNLENENIKRITEFNEFNKLFKKEKEIVINQLASCYITKVGSLEIGLACINSAWRSSGRGGIEKGLMIIGENQVRECANALDECDIKICMFHHPTSWLADCEQLNVEKQLNGFDMVLNGHIHELDSKHITDFIGETLYNVTGKFDNSCDYYNGYSFLAINPNSYNCNIVARHFQDKRNCYEKAAHLNSTGEFSIDLKSKDKDKQNAYLIVNSINTPFMEYANSYLVTNVVEGYNKNTFDQLFIEPKFKLLTEYKKELTVEHDSVENVELETGIDEQCDKEIKLKELFLDDNNYFINGKKEIGKTTLLHYFVKHFCENFKTFGKVPIIIECLGQKFRGNTPIEKLIQTFIMNYADNDFKINMNDIICLLNKGLVIVLFDNFDSLKKDSDEKSIKSINEFLSNYPNCRYFFTEDETIRNFDYEDELYIACQYKKIYMQSMSKNQIRSLTERLIGISDSEKCTPIVDKLLTCFQNTNLPKTPFVTSLILSVCKENKTFEPVNEAIIMDNFMEILLEKISAGDAIRSQYDYNLKIDFLQYLVMEMKKNNRFYFSCLEFNQITLDYHKYHGFDLRSSQFNTLFFKKNILLQDDEKIKFRYSCMIEYLIAKKAKDNTDFLDEIMCEDRYLDYYNELVFYTGLVKNGKGILAYIENIFENLLNNYESILDELTDYNIMFQHTITKEKLETELLAEKRLTIEERDEITDKNDNSSQDDSINKKRVEGDIEKKKMRNFW
ncbi:metallophosphoesterase [Acetobacterium wieringae]|uniref:metallophosphoesterase n=1 Tax=Acetobacterium wieringae TaxID=52694 RepID=UPI002034572B|nr:metallophosphoesterase [Acetobacterium wieringae]URN82796.1 metallophosphoesterase [Acetobacterium wieringae]